MIRKLIVILPWNKFLDVHLEKDVGLFPYYLSQEYGYKPEIVFYNETTLNEWRGIKLKKLENPLGDQECPSFSRFPIQFFKYIKPFKDYIRNNVRATDCLMFFHLNPPTLFLINYVRKINRQIKIYVKSDRASFRGIRDKIICNLILKHNILVSVETKKFYDMLSGMQKYNNTGNLFCAPNGIDDQFCNACEIEKEKIFLAVGRFGSFPKNTELLLKVIPELNLKEWKVIFAGSIEMQEQNFSEKIEKWFCENPSLRKSVHFLGNISDRNELYKLYARSSVFLMPSRWENFSLALLEAVWFGCYLIATNVGAANEICQSTGRGFIIPNSEQGKQEMNKIEKYYLQQMQDIIDERVNLAFGVERQISYVRDKYAMSNIIKQKNFKDFFKDNNSPVN